MNRRQFLALSGAATTGLWLGGVGFIQLPRRMVIAISGYCSFCSKSANEVFGLAGITGRQVRVCNECIDICFEILADNLLLNSRQYLPPVIETQTSATIVSPDDPELAELLRYGRKPQTEAEISALMEQVRKLISQSQTKANDVSHAELSCSFCDRKQSETSKLIAGPQVYICDMCIGDAAALISFHK
jgi:hypothetical protein